MQNTKNILAKFIKTDEKKTKKAVLEIINYIRGFKHWLDYTTCPCCDIDPIEMNLIQYFLL